MIVFWAQPPPIDLAGPIDDSILKFLKMSNLSLIIALIEKQRDVAKEILKMLDFKEICRLKRTCKVVKQFILQNLQIKFELIQKPGFIDLFRVLPGNENFTPMKWNSDERILFDMFSGQNLTTAWFEFKNEKCYIKVGIFEHEIIRAKSDKSLIVEGDIIKYNSPLNQVYESETIIPVMRYFINHDHEIGIKFPFLYSLFKTLLKQLC